MPHSKPLLALLATSAVAAVVVSVVVPARPATEVGAAPAPPRRASPPVDVAPTTTVRLSAVADDAWWVPLTSSTGAHFRVSSDCTSDAVVAAALDAAEDAWPATLALIESGPIVIEGERLEIRLIRSKTDYKARDAEMLKSGYMKASCGWADFRRHTAYVVMNDSRFDFESAGRFGPGSRVTGVIAHEAAHLVASLCFPNSGTCTWFDEGVAQVVEERLLAERAPGGDVAAHPQYSSYLAECRRLRDEQHLPDVRSILRGALDKHAFDDYAVAWEFFRFLGEPSRRGRTSRLLAGAHALPSGAVFAPSLARLFEAIWPGKDFDVLADEWRGHETGLVPRWDVWAWNKIDVTTRLWRQVAAADEQSAATRWEKAGGADYRIAGKFEIFRRTSDEVRVVFGRSDAGGVAVQFKPGAGVGVWAWDSRTDASEWLARGTAVRPGAGERTSFEIRVAGGEARVSVDGREALRADLGGRDVSGRWGVVVPPGAIVVWEDVALESSTVR